MKRVVILTALVLLLISALFAGTGVAEPCTSPPCDTTTKVVTTN